MIETAGGSALPIAADVAREDDARRYVAETIATFGRLDIMINNAGVIAVERALETSVESWDRVFAVNARITGSAPGEAKEAAARDIPLGRSGRPVEEVAATVAFLASNDASFITGEAIFVDGGLVRF